MFYYLHLLNDLFPPLRIFHYVTVRAVAGAGTAFLLTLMLAPWIIGQLRRLKIGQQERKEEAPPLYALHSKKEGTPTMGGVIIIASITISVLLWAVPTSIYVWLTLLTMLFMGYVGFIDDFLKVTKRNTKGLSGRKRLAMELGWAILVGAVLLMMPETRESTRNLMVPFLKEPLIRDLGVICAILFISVVLVGATNAVNLTDGLDGLAIGCSGSVAIAYVIMAYVAGHAEFAKYLHVPAIPGAGELAVFCGCLLGASLGFLWYNCHPAQVFMGDTGSLALGGSIAMVAILIKQELTLMIVGGVFVMEALSVILQVASFKLRGKRIFAMAPIHHHFEMRNWSETQVTVRFWILSIIFAIIGVLTLKLR